MDKIREIVSNLWEEFGAWVIAIVGVVSIVALLVAGYSFITTILMFLILGLAVWRSLPMLLNSVIVAVLLKLLSDSFKPFTAIWFAGPQHEQLYVYLQATGYVAMILLVFLVMFIVKYVLDAVTRLIGSFQPVYIDQHIGQKKVSE